MDDTPKSHTNSNVYILGAGFGSDAGFPLVADFLDRARDSMAWLEKEGRREEAAAVSEVLKFRLEAASAAYRVQIDVEDIEQLFSLASARERDDHNKSLSDSVKLCIAATLDYARHHQKQRAVSLGAAASEAPFSGEWKHREERGDANSERLYDIPAYQYYAGMMAGAFCENAGSNTIITLNYDMLVEDALLAMGCPVDYGFAKNQTDAHPSWKERQGDRKWTMPVLKLHGSVNWAYPGGKGQSLTVFGSYDDVRIAELAPNLVPPTWRKEFGEPLGNVWAQAVSAIERATRIFVIGFSMPETDPHFKYLLAAGLQRNISLRKVFYVNPCVDEEGRSELARRLLRILRPELLTKGVIVLRQNKTEELFLSNEERPLLERGPTGKFVLRYTALLSPSS